VIALLLFGGGACACYTHFVLLTLADDDIIKTAGLGWLKQVTLGQYSNARTMQVGEGRMQRCIAAAACFRCVASPP